MHKRLLRGTHYQSSLLGKVYKNRNPIWEMRLIINSRACLSCYQEPPTRSDGKPMPIAATIGNMNTEHLLVSHPKRKFQILSSPDLHAHVVSAQILKVGLADSKQATSHSRRSVKREAKLWFESKIFPGNYFIEGKSFYDSTRYPLVWHQKSLDKNLA